MKFTGNRLCTGSVLVRLTKMDEKERRNCFWQRTVMNTALDHALCFSFPPPLLISSFTIPPWVVHHNETLQFQKKNRKRFDSYYFDLADFAKAVWYEKPLLLFIQRHIYWRLLMSYKVGSCRMPSPHFMIFLLRHLYWISCLQCSKLVTRHTHEGSYSP